MKSVLMPLFVLTGLCASVYGQVTNDPPEGFIEKRAALSLDQATALKVHNDERATQKLTALVWDSDLATQAQTWADHLASINQLQHSTSAQRPNQGENLAWSFSTNGVRYPMTQGSQGWVNERSYYHGEIIPQGNFSDYGHYTQVMWTATKRVGIANATAANGGVYTVARYSPPGNYVGYRPY